MGLLALAAMAAAAYLLTALLGLWAAYDRDAAGQRFALIALGVAAAAALALLGRFGGNRRLALAGLACAWAAAAVAAYYLLTYDWQADAVAKPGFTLFLQIGLWIQAHRPGLPVPENIHSNVAAGAIALLAPLGAAGAAWSLSKGRYRLLAWLSLLALLLAAAALLLTLSRGALLGIAAGLAAAGYLAWRRESRLAQRWGRAADLLVAALGAASVFGGLVLLGQADLGSGSVASRPQMWRWAADLIADYPFTGSGLGSTMMVHASYLLVIHVGFLAHVHNLFLQIGVEQGIPGMVAFLALLALAMANLAVAYRQRGNLWLIGGAVVALTVLVVHGMFDAVPYYSRLAPVTYLPLGFALGVTARRRTRAKTPGASPRPAPASAALAAAFLLVAALAVVAFSRPGQAAVQANLGAVAQTRAELEPYTWPEWPVQDALRRSPEIDLGLAVARYQAALASDPRNATANRRLGQIELSQGAYDAARLRLEMAYAQAPQRHANRYLLGESYAVTGQEAKAADLWRSVNSQLWWDEEWLARSVLQGREYWYTSIGEPQRAEALRSVQALLEAQPTP